VAELDAALSASVGGIAAGAPVAPLAVSPLCLEGALIATAALTMGYAGALLAPGSRGAFALRLPRCARA
jgi:hypothetical protein